MQGENGGLIEEVNVVEKQKTSERIAIHALQKQIQLLKYKEWLLMSGFVIGAALLRVPMQAVPSAEPISFFAILSGWLFGRKKGFMVGASALYVSNFITIGGQGIWTIFQALGFGAIGFLGGFLRKKSTLLEILLVTSIGTIMFEIIVNIGSIFVFPIGILGIFLSALPFSAVHLSSNLIFSCFLPKTKNIIEKKGKFDEREICNDLIGRFHKESEKKILLGKFIRFISKLNRHNRDKKNEEKHI